MKEFNQFRLLAAVLVGFGAGALTVNVGLPVLAAPDQRSPVEIELAGEKVRLGSAKAQVVTRLSKELVLENRGKQVGGSEFWFVRAKGEQATSVGSLQFENDVLVTATREWSEIEPDVRTLTFMKSFYGAVERVFDNGMSGRVKCTLKREPGNEHFQIDLFRQGRNVSLAFVEDTRTGRFGIVEESVSR